MRWARYIARIWKNPEMHAEFQWKDLRGKRPLERPRRRWEDNNKMGLKEVGCDSRNCMDTAQVRDQWRASIRV